MHLNLGRYSKDMYFLFNNRDEKEDMYENSNAISEKNLTSLTTSRNILDEIRESELEITTENAEAIAKTIEEEKRREIGSQTPPREQTKMHRSPIPHSPPQQSIHDRLGPKNQDKSQRSTPVKERLGEKHFDSPPRQSTREIYDTNSQEETQGRTPVKKRLGDKRASSEQETSQRQTPVKERLGERHTSSGREDTRRENPEPRRKSKRTRDQSSLRLRSGKKPKTDPH